MVTLNQVTPIPITDLPAATTITGNEATAIVQGGVTVQTPLNAIPEGIAAGVVTYGVTGGAPFPNYRTLKAGDNISFSDGGPQGDLTISASTAPDNAAYIVVNNTSSLINERALAVSTGLTTMDAGAGSTFTIGIASTQLIPSQSGHNGEFLTTDGTTMSWSVISGMGTVTNVSVSNANGVSGVVSNPTTTPDITLTLGAITPSSVNASGTVAGSNLSGTNTGDVSLAGENYLSITGQQITANPVDLSTSNVTGVLPIASGGTNATTATFAINNLLPPQSTHGGEFLTTDGTTASWASAGGGGTVTTTGSPANGNLTAFSGSTSITNTDLSGDVSTSGSTLTAIGAGKVTNNMLAGSIDLATKVTGTLATGNGGTGNTTYTQGDIIYASSSTTLSKLAKDTNATRYLSNTGTSNNPAWAQINVANGVTGTLPIGNGGTGLAAVGSANAVLNVNAGGTGLQYAFGMNQSLQTVNSPTFAGLTLSTTPLGTSSGGTGNTTYTQGDILYASNSTTLSKLAKDTNSTRYLSNTGSNNNPAWAQLDLSNGVTGILPVANGGTSTTTLTTGNVILGNGTSAVQFVSPNTTGNVLTASGTTWTSSPPATGTTAQAKMTIITATGSGTFITSSIVTSSTVFKITVTGGGGGGGGSNAAGAAGAGGGAAATCIYVVSGLSANTGYAYSVATGGNGGASGTGATGSTGNNSTVTIGATTVTANGGVGGSGGLNANSTCRTGGAGGTGSNGSLNITGGDGTNSCSQATNAASAGGNGGATVWGMGGRGAAGAGGGGVSGSAYGSGGGGGVGSASTGGAGANGVITFEWNE